MMERSDALEAIRVSLVTLILGLALGLVLFDVLRVQVALPVKYRVARIPQAEAHVESRRESHDAGPRAPRRGVAVANHEVSSKGTEDNATIASR